MIKKFSLAIIACLVGVLAATAPAHAGVNKRQAHQQARIAQGTASGSLTTREATRLNNQQNRIARYEAKSRADGNGLSPRERANIARMQNHANRSIRRQKHDGQHK